MESGIPVPGSYYIYAPNHGAAIFFTVMFAASAVYHIWQCRQYKIFNFTPLFLVCGVLLMAGFAVRTYGTFHYDELSVYLVSTILIYFAPPLLELQNYHTLGRILYYVPYMSPMHPGRVSSTFGVLSALVEVLNAIGVSYATNPFLSQDFTDLGNGLMKASLALQIVVVALFYLLAGYVHLRCTRVGLNPPRIRVPLFTLYISSGLIFVRTVYRMVEYFGYSNIRSVTDSLSLSPILRFEWFFYVFEATMMLANLLLWNWHHPGRYLPQNSRVYLRKDGAAEVEGPGWKDTRSFIVTLMDPFGFAQRRNEKVLPFWDLPHNELHDVSNSETFHLRDTV